MQKLNIPNEKDSSTQSARLKTSATSENPGELTPAGKKTHKSKMSGLRRTIRSIFLSKKKDMLSSKSQTQDPEFTSHSRRETEKENKKLAADGQRSPSDSQTLGPTFATSSHGNSETGEAGDKKPVVNRRVSSSRCVPPGTRKSGFHMHNGHASYHGSTLYQCSDLVPELDILDRWIELGSGETSTTRLVHIVPENGKLAAAKILLGNEPEARFHRETNAMHMVRNHPSFVELIGVVEQSPMRCILQKFVGNDFIPENLTLEDVLNNKKVKSSEIPRKEWLQIAKDISDGIQYLHQQNYIHLNIKPDNILLYATNGSWKGWRAKICDLGDCTSARLAPKINSISELKMTAEETTKPFVAPEVLSGQGPFTMAADVFALGRVLRVIGRKAKISSLWKIGKKCSCKRAFKRPNMDKVCKQLHRASSKNPVHFIV